MIKELQKGKWLLTHDRYVNDMGFETDAFDLFDTEKRIHIPFHGMIKLHNKGNDFPLNKIPYDYTVRDYEAMLDNEVAKLIHN